MQEFSEKNAPHQLPFEAYGVEMRICTNSAELLKRVLELIPAGWHRRTRSESQYRIALMAEADDMYAIYNPQGICVHDSHGEEYALLTLETHIQGYLSYEATDYVFVHAGVVADGERAIVMPGLSFAGKTTLVRALVESGAVYYSDEFAVLDESGLVHPYAKPLAIRAFQKPTVNYPVGEFGGVAGEGPLRVGMVLATRYQSGAEWSPRELSTGAGVLAVLEHTVPAQSRPDQSLRVLKRALGGAVILQGERGEADDLAGELLETFRAAA